MTASRVRVGDWMIYRKTKRSNQPGPRAKGVRSAQRGDDYAYTVDKFWVVAEIIDDERIQLRTRQGKEHVISMGDPQLRRANWWERFLYRDRFAAVASSTTSSDV